MSTKMSGFAMLAFLVAATAVAAVPDPAITDDAMDMVLSVEDNGTRFSWELGYGKARQTALVYLKEGDKEKALQAAKMQFVLCPPDAKSVAAAIASVKEMLTAVDGNDTRAKQFEAYAAAGSAGPDGKGGTADDLTDPIKDVRLTNFAKDAKYFEAFDKTIDERASVSATWEKAWYETEKAFARLDGADFGGAARVLAATLGEQVKIPHAVDDENWELQRIQDIIDRISAGLGVYYKSKNGTTAGMKEFVESCMNYAKYGPMGPDGQMGTADDLQPPM